MQLNKTKPKIRELTDYELLNQKASEVKQFVDKFNKEVKRVFGGNTVQKPVESDNPILREVEEINRNSEFFYVNIEHTN